MNVVPQIEPISRLQRDHNSVLQQLQNGPVFLTHHGDATAVMVSAEAWNMTAKRLAFFERMMIGDQASARIEAGEYNTLQDVEEALSL